MCDFNLNIEEKNMSILKAFLNYLKNINIMKSYVLVSVEMESSLLE
jgi:hypothetical protein